MTDEQARELGRRALKACPRLLSGMQGWWVDSQGSRHRPRIDGSPGPWITRPDAGLDVRDPATLGCLLALVREAWGRGTVEVRSRKVDYVALHRWEYTYTEVGLGASEAEALVAALEAAP